MADRFTVTNTAGSLGDWLSLTPLLRAMRDAGRDPLVIAKDSPHTREFATLYQGLAEVQFTDANIPATPEAAGDGRCFSQRILTEHGLRGANPIPYVVLEAEELVAAQDLLSCRHVDAAKAVVVAPSPGGARADLADEHIANYRRWPTALRDRLIERLHAQGLLPVRFGTRAKQSHIYANHEDVPGVLCVPDLTLRQLAACYAVIGRYCGSDTGDHHLMLAVGGSNHTWVPPSTWFYRHDQHLYGASAWAEAGEAPRETYSIYPREMPTLL